MGILFFIVFGLVIGFIARALLPGRQSMGLVTTALLGMAGSLIGGFLGNLLAGRPLLDLHAAGFFGSLLCSILLLAALGASRRRRRLI
ncbi:MAG TPA: GlsB/YeaQ/YmgE family stress response membrane protein [Polyangiaceae bacterium]